jgi:hypothetical protein
VETSVALADGRQRAWAGASGREVRLKLVHNRISCATRRHTAVCKVQLQMAMGRRSWRAKNEFCIDYMGASLEPPEIRRCNFGDEAPRNPERRVSEPRTRPFSALGQLPSLAERQSSGNKTSWRKATLSITSGGAVAWIVVRLNYCFLAAKRRLN